MSAATGAPTFGTTLVVRFDPGKVNDLVKSLALPMWPEPRPRPVLWLAINDGSGPRLVGLQQNNAARPVLDRAQARGFRLGLPQGNAAEQATVGAIWRGDTGAVARVSSRYNPPMQLIGKLYRVGNGWRSDWIFVDNGRALSRWSKTSSDARTAMAAGADGAADALIAKYARRPPPPPPPPAPSTVQVLFTGIDNADDYLRLMGYLERSNVVKRATPLHASPRGLLVELLVDGGLSGLRADADRGGVVVPEDAGESTTAVFRVR